MKRGIIITLLMGIILFISGCSDDDLNSFNEEQELLNNRISELEEQISEKDEEIKRLKNSVSAVTEERDQLKESIGMIRFSAYARLEDYEKSFDNLKNIYKISSKHVIMDDWYVIQEEKFQLELLGFEEAKKVDFYILRLESDEGKKLIFSDTDNKDGWKYTNDNISQIIDKHKEPNPKGFSYEPYFVIFAEVELDDGNIITTSKLPIYNR